VSSQTFPKKAIPYNFPFKIVCVYLLLQKLFLGGELRILSGKNCLILEKKHREEMQLQLTWSYSAGF
jgi:hypothetical protein